MVMSFSRAPQSIGELCFPAVNREERGAARLEGSRSNTYIRPMAHNNGQIPRRSGRKPSGVAAAKFEAAVAANPIAPAGTAYDPAPPPPADVNFVPHRPQRPAKSEGGKRFKLVSEYQPAGDQPTAIRDLVAAANSNERDQVLLGVTGSGKTFTMAKVIEAVQRPALILAPNKTLAAQLYAEMKNFFPENAVEYFVSYYDYYQPEAYIPRTDTYIEKDSSINEEIDRMRHAATRAILERDDVIIVASVSCIYGIGSVETYSGTAVTLARGARIDRMDLMRELSALQYRRNDDNFVRGSFRVRGDTIDLFPAHYEDRAWRIELFGDEIDSHLRIRSAHRQVGGEARSGEGVCEFALRHPAPHAATGDEGHQGRADRPAG